MNSSTIGIAMGLLLSLAGAAGCTGSGEDALEPGEVEDFADGKGDGIERPLGTYNSQDPAPGLVSLTLGEDRTFSRTEAVICISAPCDPIEVTGSYRFTKSGSRRFIRFRDEDGDLIDRHEYTLRGRTLQLRAEAAAAWRTFYFSSGGEPRPGSATYVDSADGMECELSSVHCVTTDAWSCPQITPLPPDFCPDGEVRQGEVRYIDSADGLECAMPSVHCVTLDPTACPQLSPRPPGWCADGEAVRGPDNFVPSADGMECAMPEIHCLTLDNDACPQVTPLPPDFCAP